MLGHIPARRAVIQKLPGRCYLALRHHPLSPRHPPELASGLQSGASAFNGQIPLHLGQTGHDMKEKPSRGCSGIDGVGQAFELNVPSLQTANQVDQIPHAASQTIQLPDHQRIPYAELSQQ